MATPTAQQRLDPARHPGRSPCMHQRWQALAFLHWKIAPEPLAKLLPPGLTLDLFDGSAWLGVVPFRMRAIRPAGLPALPWLSYFLEMNLRTYVFDSTGRPGVWFFSLDCNQPVAVRIARWFFGLPYFDAVMSEIQLDNQFSHYRVQRRGYSLGSLKYRMGKPLPPPAPGTLEHFLLERYLLFSWNEKRKQLYSGQVHHTPYPPCELELLEWTTLPIEQIGLPAPKSAPDHVIASQGVQVEVFGLQKVS